MSANALAQNGQQDVQKSLEEPTPQEQTLQKMLQEIRAIQILNKARPSDRRGRHIQYRSQQIEKELLKLRDELPKTPTHPLPVHPQSLQVDMDVVQHEIQNAPAAVGGAIIQDTTDSQTERVSHVRFRNFIHTLKEESFSSDKLSLLSDFCREHRISVRQAFEIFGHFRFASEKIQASAIIADQLVDPQHGHKLLRTVRFRSEKQKMRAILHSARQTESE